MFQKMNAKETLEVIKSEADSIKVTKCFKEIKNHKLWKQL